MHSVSQQERMPVHGSLVTVHAPLGTSHRWVAVTQLLSQQSLLTEQMSPAARQ